MVHTPTTKPGFKCRNELKQRTIHIHEESTCLLYFVGFLQSEAIWLGAFVARRAGQTVVARVCVYTLCDTDTLHFTLPR